MESDREYELLFDAEVEAELADRGVHIQDEIQRANAELVLRQGRSHAEGAERGRDVVTVITAIAALAPLVVPIVKEIIKRKLPHIETEVIIETGADDRTVLRVVRKES
jgi:hypothetical protein